VVLSDFLVTCPTTWRSHISKIFLGEPPGPRCAVSKMEITTPAIRIPIAKILDSPLWPRNDFTTRLPLVTSRHFRSRDKYVGHTIRSAINENPMLQRKLRGSTFSRTGFTADRNFTLRKQGFWTIF